MKKLFYKDRILTLVGMTFFWSFFRHPTVLQRMFPVGDTFPVFGFDISLLGIFLGVLLFFGILIFIFSNKLFALCVKKRWIILLMSILGTIGIILSFADEASSAFSFWLSTVCFSAGFLAIYLAWASYFSRHFSLEALLNLSITFFLSLLIFTGISSYLPSINPFVIEMIPFASGLCFYLLSEIDEEVAERPRSSREIPRNKLLYVALFIAFLLTGSLTRGIVDSMNQFSATGALYNFRWVFSLFISVLIVVLFLISYRKFANLVDSYIDSYDKFDFREYEYSETGQLTLKCWVLLVVVFFAGMFVVLGQQNYSVGGHIVVAARSCLDFLLWILLCSIAASENLKSTRLFLLSGMLTMIISWALSYLLMPTIIHGTEDFFASAQGIVVLFSLFFLISVLTLLFGAISLKREVKLIPRLAPASDNARPSGVSADFVSRYHLTQREAEVAYLFAQGYSLSKVASELYISIGTAQSHMKNIYRKLDVHTKDELIALIK